MKFTFVLPSLLSLLSILPSALGACKTDENDFLVINNLLESNKNWAQATEARFGAEFFKETTKGQSPKILWLGCSDSRTPEGVVLDVLPGTAFVHRNIANQFHAEDDSVQFSVQYAIEHLGVQHIVVAGHTHCGGCHAALLASLAADPKCNECSKPSAPRCGCKLENPQDRYLAPLTDLATSLNLTHVPEELALQLVVEQNVRRQVDNISKSEIMKKVWSEHRSGFKRETGGNTTSSSGYGEGPKQIKPVWVHGWVYDLGSGTVKDLQISRGSAPMCVPEKTAAPEKPAEGVKPAEEKPAEEKPAEAEKPVEGEKLAEAEKKVEAAPAYRRYSRFFRHSS